MKRKRSAALAWTGPQRDAAVAVLFSVFLFVSMHVWSEQYAVGAAFVALALCIGRTPWRLARERFCIPVIGFLAFMVLYGAAAIYSPFGGSAVRDFRGGLAAFAVAALVLLRVERKHVRGILWGIAGICAVVSLLCTSLACEGPLYETFCSVMGLFGQGAAGEIENTVGRINGIYNDANVSASMLALGALISLYLVQTGKKWWERLLACVMVSASAVGLLLSVSRGAILCFGLALVVWLIAAGKGQRLRLFLLMVVAAGVSLAAFAAASGAVAPGTVLPNLLAVASGGVIFLLDWAVGERLAGLLFGHGKAIAVGAGVLAVCVIMLAVAAFNLTEPYILGEDDYLYRAMPLAPGEYTIFTEWEGGDERIVIVYSRSEAQILMYGDTALYGGPVDEAVFTVPEDAKRVYFQFRGNKGDVLRSISLSDGTKIPLEYKLLPQAVSLRLQEGLFIDNSYLLRLQYDKDAWKLFKQSPVFGHGLGSTDNLYPSVQPFYYTSRYVHNHIMQVMADMGLLGLVSFLVFLGGILWLLIRRLKKGQDALAAVLLACWVMMNTHSLMELSFSVQAYQGVAFVLLLLPAALYGGPLTEKTAKMGGAAVCVVFWMYLAVFGGVLGVRQVVRRESATLRAASMDELMSALDSYAKRDVFDPAPYQLEYVATAVQEDSGQYDLKMVEYVEKIRNSGNYPACSGLAEHYYLQLGDFKELFACSRECLLQRASYAEVWNGQMEFYRTKVLFAAGPEHMEEYIDGIMDYCTLLNEVNQTLMTEIVLTRENQAFIDWIGSGIHSGLTSDQLYDFLITAEPGTLLS